MRTSLLVVLLLVLFAIPAVAQDVFQEGTTITVKLMNGDTLTGLLEDTDGARLVILHDILGRIEIPRASIAPTPPEPVVEPVSPWSGKFDLSLTGSTGNSETQGFRTQLDVKRDDAEAADFFTLWMRRTETRTLDDPATPAVDEDDTEVTEEKKFGQWRHEWKLKESKWRPFVQAGYETDQLAGYNSRASVAGGGAYQFRDDDAVKLSGRLGGGYSRKFGTDDPEVDDDAYEALLGGDWYWNITKLSLFSLVMDFYPNISDSGEFLSITKLAYELKMEETTDWFVKLGADNFHDSEPGAGKKQNDWNYYVGLGRSF